MPPSVLVAPPGTRGFDCNAPLSDAEAATFAAAGYRFAVRYLPRVTPAAIDLTAAEVTRILGAGLGLMAVQHVESEDGWMPSADKGTAYGQVAATHAANCGLLPGTMVWLDLEGVAVGTAPATVTDYCNNWCAGVTRAGFTAGLYVGWHSGLDSQALYQTIRVEHYWAAYNLDRDEEPAVRGVQMRQSAAPSPAGIPFAIDADVTLVDAQGGAPLILVPDGWPGDG